VDSLAGYHPLCLLDETSKLFERIVATRIVWHFFWEGGVNLFERRYDFRSTVDAICWVRTFAEANAQEGRVIVRHRQRILTFPLG